MFEQVIKVLYLNDNKHLQCKTESRLQMNTFLKTLYMYFNKHLNQHQQLINNKLHIKEQTNSQEGV